MNDYKNTLNLPYTWFPMRGNLAKREPIMLQRWYEQDLYNLVRHAKKGKKMFLLHDGPPYANGNIHIGHSINKVLKDIILKYKGLMGYDTPFIPGWDCHGLPIELQVEKLIGKPGEKVSAAEFRATCRHYAANQIEEQKRDFIRLGILGDWKHSYLTMDFITEANTIRALSKIIANGHLYNGAKPVHWCIDCRSTLAEAETEYYDHISPSIYVAFIAIDADAVAAKFGVNNFIGQISVLIWTTTPWTIPANRAIAINPNCDYQLVDIGGQGYILAATLADSVMARIGITYRIAGSNIKGKKLEFLRFRHPFMDFDVPIILGSYITLDSGTGAVHTAPGHGPSDYIIGQQYNLEVINIIGPDGCYLPGIMPGLDGLQVSKANDIVISILHDNNALLHTEKIKHNYPHCWRHKTPIIFRTTSQWFISMDQNNLREQVLAEIKDVQWIPSWGQSSIETMVANRPDWCISRQRTWGVPMTLFIHNKTNDLHPRTIELMEEIAKLVEQNGIEAWWNLELKEILGNDATHYHKLTDSLDIWFDSGSTNFSVLASMKKFNNHISDMYLEGSDQHRGWFMSSLIISTAIYGRAPYRQVLTHSFAVDNQGRKMSKSVGNIVSPQRIIDNLGADILRLWVASTDYTNEMIVSNEILERSTDTYRRIRNTARFLLANLNGFNPIYHIVNPEQMIVLDRWAVSQAQKAQIEIIAAYESYNFHSVVRRIMRFCSIEMGSFYLDIIKDRQYTSKTGSIIHRSCQTALYHIIEAMVRWIAPILSFTADEIWSFIPGKRSQYIFTEEWYDGLSSLDNSQLMNDAYWQTLLQVRNETNKIIEQARSDRRIGSSLEAHITLYANPTLASLLRALEDELYFVLLTSSATVANYNEAKDNSVQCDGLQGLKIALKKADGKKCSRCWHYKMDTGQYQNYPKICGRCVTNIVGVGEKRKFV